MRIFQNSGLYPTYLKRLDKLAAGAATFESRLDVFFADRFGAVHFLLPVLEKSADAFFTNHDDETLQALWARAQGMPATATREDILLAQMEQHRTEVFYDIDPTNHPPNFLGRLPGSVRARIAWRAAPLGNASLGGYDLVVCNFPGIIANYRSLGWRSEYFWPAHDPAMDEFAANSDRPVDLIFVGGYTRHHRRRAELLEALARLEGEYHVALHLDCSRLTRLAESPLGWLLPLSQHRRPANIRRVAEDPVFGRDLYTAVSRAKIVVNGAIDMAGSDRGNMRCFETMGLGTLLLSDEGTYPSGMRDGVTMMTYSSVEHAMRSIRELLSDQTTLAGVAAAGQDMVRTQYSKARQWELFQTLVASCSR
jgi:hypothetical protein